MNRIGVVVFPGSNCEYDALEAMSALGAEAQFVWHSATHLDGFDGVILPGGFAHGDYLRPGALARFSPVMEAVAQFARAGGAVLGICNGFQVLTEAGLLPGALQKNRGLTFLCQPTTLIVESTKSVRPKARCRDSGALLTLTNYPASPAPPALGGSSSCRCDHVHRESTVAASSVRMLIHSSMTPLAPLTQMPCSRSKSTSIAQR